MPRQVARINAALGVAPLSWIVATFVAIGCGADDGSSTATSHGPAGAGGGGGETTTSAGGGGSSGTGAAGGGDAICFMPYDSTTQQCEDACAPVAACPLSFGTCNDACAIGGYVLEQMIRCSTFASGDCDAFKQCVDCTNVCLQGENCSPPIPEGACCTGCMAAPSCWAPNDAACDVIAACADAAGG